MTFILFGRSPTWWPSGDAESSRFCWAPKRPGSMLPDIRNDVTGAVARLCQGPSPSSGLVQRSGVSTDTVAVQLVTLSGVPHLRMHWTHKQKRAVRRRVPVMIALQRCKTMREDHLSAQIRSGPGCSRPATFLFVPLRSGRRAVDGPHSLLHGPTIRD